MDEAARIARFFAPLSFGEPGSFSLSDDAAVLNAPPARQLVLTTDSVIAGIHLPKDATPEQIAVKLMRRNLSDLAAMGAAPWRYLLNLHTPLGTEDHWFEVFSSALAGEQQRFHLLLVGGDSTSGTGPVHATMTCMGLLDGKPLMRSGAKAGDILYVSGTIGDAALGLKLLQRKLKAPKAVRSALLDRYYRPEPRLALGQALRGVASAAIDISDGLLADAAKLFAASGVGGMIVRDAVPMGTAATPLVKESPALWETILAGGDDYELCFTAPWAAAARVEAVAQKLSLPLTRIGSIGEGRDLTLVDGAGNALAFPHRGWEYA